MSNIIPGCKCIIIGADPTYRKYIGHEVEAIKFISEEDAWLIDLNAHHGKQTVCDEHDLMRIDGYQPTKEELEDLLTDISDVIKEKDDAI
jgi:hypothetical protein